MSDWDQQYLDRLMRESGSILDRLSYRQDNPAVSRGDVDWLQRKQRRAEELTPKHMTGPVTGYFREPINIPTWLLERVEGALNERPTVGRNPKFERLLDRVLTEGWNPTPISVGVNHKGTPYITEGNTRNAMARALQVPYLPGELYWLNGGELAESRFTPQALAPHLDKVNTPFMDKYVPPQIPAEVQRGMTWAEVADTMRRMRGRR
jgi:hypothetical protein